MNFVKPMVCNGQFVLSNSGLNSPDRVHRQSYLLLASSYWKAHS